MLVDNLVKINGASHPVELKCGYLYESNRTRYLFNTTFATKCLSVLLTDVASDSAKIYKHSVDNVGNDGFDFFTSWGSKDTVFFLAIGY